jgi:microcystin-dependent protein
MSAEHPLPRRRFIGRALAALTTGAWLGRAANPDRAEAAPQVEQPFFGEIRMFAGWYAPAGWAFCQGQMLSIAQNDVLFSLIGTTYGGDGVTTFALPDLRGRVPVHMGTGSFGTTYQLGQMAGVESPTLTTQQIPAHSHAPGASSVNGTSDSPAAAVPARNAAGLTEYGSSTNATLAAGALQATGGGQPHTNLQPYLGIHFIICLEGIYPSQS